MTSEDAERWDTRYEGRPIADPSPPDALAGTDLTSLIARTGRMLDVACGAGGQSAWFAQQGFDVLAVDASEAAIELTSTAAAASGVAERVDARVVDLDGGLPDDVGSFDVIVCQRFRGVHLYDAFVTHLTPGGIGIVTVLSQTGASSPGPFHAPPGELLTAFDRPEAEILVHTAADGQESIIIRHP